MTDKRAVRAELDGLRSEWRKALLTAREALRAEKGFLPDEELAAHERHLRAEYTSAAAELRQFAKDEGIPTELAEPFLSRGLSRRALGLPKRVTTCVFELDDVLVGSSALQRDAWKQTLDELLAAHADTRFGSITPFDPHAEYTTHIEGRSRLEGVREFLASRGIRLPEGDADDPPGRETVHGVANRKNELVGRLLAEREVGAFDGVRHYLELAHDAGIRCVVVSASTHTGEMLERSGLSDLIDESTDARSLGVDPATAAAFETSVAGVVAARKAGFAWIVAIEPTGDADALHLLRRAGANIAARGLGDLLGR
ncbi:MAG TPA: hypothetical protein VGH79_11895 [Gaiellaceae bacterium]|jgi:beta-phosphoglucomutase-like phosphatase (HAD superfamily)